METSIDVEHHGLPVTFNHELACLFSPEALGNWNYWTAYPSEVVEPADISIRDHYVPVEVDFVHNTATYNGSVGNPESGVRDIFNKFAPPIVYDYFVSITQSPPHAMCINALANGQAIADKHIKMKYTHGHFFIPLELRLKRFIKPSVVYQEDVIRNILQAGVDSLPVLGSLILAYMAHQGGQIPKGSDHLADSKIILNGLSSQLPWFKSMLDGLGRADEEDSSGTQGPENTPNGSGSLARINNASVSFDRLRDLASGFEAKLRRSPGRESLTNQSIVKAMLDLRKATLHLSDYEQAMENLNRGEIAKWNGKADDHQKAAIQAGLTTIGLAAFASLAPVHKPAAKVLAGLGAKYASLSSVPLDAAAPTVAVLGTVASGRATYGEYAEMNKSFAVLNDLKKASISGHIDLGGFFKALRQTKAALAKDYMEQVMQLPMECMGDHEREQAFKMLGADMQFLGNDIIDGDLMTDRFRTLLGAVRTLEDANQETMDAMKVVSDTVGVVEESRDYHIYPYVIISDAEEIAVEQAILDKIQDGDVELPNQIFKVSHRHFIRYRRLQRIADLDKAISMATEAIKLTPEGRLNRTAQIINLSVYWHEKFLGSDSTNVQARGRREDLDEAVDICREVVEQTEKNSSYALGRLGNLSITLSNRFDVLGDIKDLDETIKIVRQAIDMTKDGSLEQTAQLSNYGRFVGDRYLRTGNVSDLDESIHTLQKVCDRVQDDQVFFNKPRCLTNLGIQLSRMYRKKGTIADLKKAVDVCRKACKIVPNAELQRCFSNLAITLKHEYFLTNDLKVLDETRFSATDKIEDVEEALENAEKAAGLTPKEHLNRAAYLDTLAMQLRDMSRKTGFDSHMHEAIEHGQAVLDSTHESHPEQANRLVAQVIRYGDLFWKTNERDCHEDCRIDAAKELFKYYAAVPDWEKACQAAEIAIGLIPKLIASTTNNANKQDVLVQIYRAASDATAVAISAGKRAFAALSSKVVTDLNVLSPKDRTPGSSAHYRQTNDIDALLDEIRHNPGFEDFLTAPTKENVKNAASYGPIVVINVSQLRRDAILVERDQIRSIPLPQLTIEYLKSNSQEIHTVSPKVLEWLWDTIVEPVLNELGIKRG
ncbi:unnamed protein product [Fusarium graminearum]|nr:unnamed protein product [Fusarium graminearum]